MSMTYPVKTVFLILTAIAQGATNKNGVVKRIPKITKGECVPSQQTIFRQCDELLVAGYLSLDETRGRTNSVGVLSLTEQGLRRWHQEVEAVQSLLNDNVA